MLMLIAGLLVEWGGGLIFTPQVPQDQASERLESFQ